MLYIHSLCCMHADIWGTSVNCCCACFVYQYDARQVAGSSTPAAHGLQQGAEDVKRYAWMCAGVKGRRIRELTSVVQKRFKFPDGSVELYAEKVNNRGLCAIAQAESLRYKLLGGLAVRRYALLPAV